MLSYGWRSVARPSMPTSNKKVGQEMSDKLQRAIELIQSGDKQTGRQLLVEILKAEPANEIAWLWMSSVVTTDEQRCDCLRQVLAINPNNQVAKRGLERLQQNQGHQPAPIKTPPIEVQPQPVALTSSLSRLTESESFKAPKETITPLDKMQSKRTQSGAPSHESAGAQPVETYIPEKAGGGPTAKKKPSLKIWVIAAGLFIVGLLGAGREILHLIDELALQREGVVVNANVIDFNTKLSRRSGRHYYVEYSFLANGQVVTASDKRLSESDWEQAVTTLELQVIYLPGNLKVNRPFIPGEGRGPLTNIMLNFALYGCALSFSIILLGGLVMGSRVVQQKSQATSQGRPS